MRPTIKSLITQDLGYCCLWFFFQRYKLTGMIAARLGVSKRAVQYAKASVKNGECQCDHSPNCMKRVVKKLRPLP